MAGQKRWSRRVVVASGGMYKVPLGRTWHIGWDQIRLDVDFSDLGVWLPPVPTPPFPNPQTTALRGCGCSSRPWPHRPEMISAQMLLGDGQRQGLVCHSPSVVTSPGHRVPGERGGCEEGGRQDKSVLAEP